MIPIPEIAFDDSLNPGSDIRPVAQTLIPNNAQPLPSVFASRTLTEIVFSSHDYSSYARRSRLVGVRALMILILSPRSVYDTTSNRRLKDSPIEMNRGSTNA